MLNQQNQQKITHQRINEIKNISVAELLVMIKKNINSTSNSQISDDLLTEKQAANKIINYIIRKINERTHMSSKEFISMFNMLIHLKITVLASLHNYKHKQSFYKTINFYAVRAIREWIDCSDQRQKLELNINLATLLCSLATLVKLKHQQNLDMELTHIFSPALIRAILTIKLPNQQRFLKNYKVLIYYINKDSNRQLYTELMLKSLVYHITECPATKATQITAIYILNQMVKNINSKNNKQNFWNPQNRCQLLRSLLKLLSDTLTSNQFKFTLELYTKIIGQIPAQLPSFITKGQIQQLFDSLKAKNNFLQKLPLSFKITLQKMNKQDQLAYFQLKLNQNKISPIEAEAIQICSRSINGIDLLNLIEKGHWERILYLYQNLDNSMWHIKCCFHKIIQNIVCNSSFNSDLKEFFSVLAIQSQIFKFKKVIPY